MMYTVRNKCEEIPDMEYDDGLQFIYFNTKGQKGGSQAIKNMLKYIQNSDSKNAVDDATRKIDYYVRKVKNLPEVEAGYMTLGDWIDSIVDSVKEEDIKVVVEILKELHETKDNAVLKIRSKFPEFANQAERLVEKYWKEG